MFKKIINSVLIPAFLMQIIGCYSSNDVTIINDDVKNDNFQNIDFQRIKILELTLKNNSTVLFYNNGGTYIGEEETIEGIDEKGRYISWPLTDIMELYKDKYIPIQFIKNRDKKINFALLKSDVLLEFNKDGCIIDTNKNVIHGILSSGFSIEKDLSDVKEVYSQKPETVPFEKFKKDTSLTVMSFLTKGKILVNLDKSGGRYSYQDAKIEGVTDAGDSTSVSLRDLETIKFKINKGEGSSSLKGVIIGAVIIGLITVISFVVAGKNGIYKKRI